MNYGCILISFQCFILCTKNENDNSEADYDRAKSNAEELKTMDEIPLSCEVILNAIKLDSKAQIKALFDQHQNVNLKIIISSIIFYL